MIPINVNLPLKTVSDRAQSCDEVLGAITTFGGRLTGNLGEEFVSLLEEGQVMPFATTLELFAKKLAASRDLMVETDRAYRDQRTRETLFRGRRDEQVAAVNSAVVGLRRAFTGFYRDEMLAEVGFARRTPQQPRELLEQATHLAVRLADPDLELTGSRFDDVELEVPKLAQKLAAPVDQLKLASDELAREERQTEALKLVKDEALAEHNKRFVWIARTVESFCRLAGLDEVAKRVRPSGRRPGVTEKAEEGDQAVDAPEPAVDADVPDVPAAS